MPLWSALLPGASIYYVQEVHADMPKNKAIIRATLDLIEGKASSLPTELPPPKHGWFRREAPVSIDAEARKLTDRLEEGTASAEDLSKLYTGF